jgi:hypothetical protein
MIVVALADDPDRLPSKCESNLSRISFRLVLLKLFYFKIHFEVCKFMADEISGSLKDHSSSDLIQTNYLLDERVEKKNAKKYTES